jgi:protein-L-isoaspartate(D-aspartate) O-methyltransferase
MTKAPGRTEQIALPLGSEPHPMSAAAQATMAFLLRLRARGIADVSVLRALETVPREKFVPHRHVDLALRDIALPIACGQTMPEPWLVARMMEALAIAPKHRVLEIGTGSGYATAILARLAGEVVSIERFAGLAHQSAARLEHLGIVNARVLHGDGLAIVPDLGLFDRILIHGAVDHLPDAINGALAEGGIILHGRRGEEGVTLLRIVHSPGGEWARAEICPCRLTPLVAGVARAL